MIKVTNQEEFEKCLPMLDSPDVECRLLGWELLCECTDLHRDALLVSNLYKREFLIRHWISVYNRFTYFDGYTFGNILYSSLIEDFTNVSRIYLDNTTYIKLKYK
jgi:hypothetical protein